MPGDLDMVLKVKPYPDSLPGVSSPINPWAARSIPDPSWPPIAGTSRDYLDPIKL